MRSICFCKHTRPGPPKDGKLEREDRNTLLPQGNRGAWRDGTNKTSYFRKTHGNGVVDSGTLRLGEKAFLHKQELAGAQI